VAEAVRRVRPAVSRLTVTGELDGPIAGFGNRFWQVIRERNSDVRDWLAAAQVARVEYEDRYLFSPLSVGLLASVLRALPDKAAKLPVIIRTLADRASSIAQSQPYAIFHDWRDTATRDRVLKAAVENAGFSASIEAASRQALPHGRTFRIRHSNSSTLEIMLDQGFGYWRSRHGAFDFAASVPEQVRAVTRGDIAVVGSSPHSTTLILDLSTSAR
jgi:DEAD/DEAH box helicase domain-containing protein